MKKLALILPFISLSAFCQDSPENCLAGVTSLDPSKKATTQEILNWIDASKQSAKCLGMDDMTTTLDELAESVKHQDERRKAPRPSFGCNTLIGKTVVSDTEPAYPQVSWRSATANLWKKPIYGPDGEIIGYTEKMMVSLRPDYAESGATGRVYVGLSGEQAGAFMDSNGAWKVPDKGLACREYDNSDLSVESSEEQFHKANEQMEKAMSMQDLPPELQGQLDKINEQWQKNANSSPIGNANSGRSRRNVPLCPAGYVRPDPTPPPYLNGTIPPLVQFSIDLGQEASWCPAEGPYGLFVGYGVLTNSAKKEIQRDLSYGDDMIPQIEKMIQDAKQQPNATTVEGQYWIQQMESQLRIFRQSAAKIKSQAQRGITENRMVYRNGYDQQKCWRVFTYNCPSQL